MVHAIVLLIYPIRSPPAFSRTRIERLARPGCKISFINHAKILTCLLSLLFYSSTTYKRYEIYKINKIYEIYKIYQIYQIYNNIHPLSPFQSLHSAESSLYILHLARQGCPRSRPSLTFHPIALG